MGCSIRKSAFPQKRTLCCNAAIGSWASVGCNRYKLALMEALKLHLAERSRLLEEQAASAIAAVQQPAAVAAGASQAAATGASQGDGFIEIRSAAPPAPPVLAGVQQLNEEEHVEIRGVCDGCGQNVMSNDEGRKREGDNYYHAECVRGQCGGCGRVVHTKSARASIRGVYWHAECL